MVTPIKLVGYSGSSTDSSEEDDNEHSQKRRKIIKQNDTLPLPDSIKVMFKEEEDGSANDRFKHEGRVRHFPHVRGQWPTFIYITVTLPDEVQTCLTSFYKKLTTLLPLSDLWPEVHLLSSCDLHLSLSRTVPILYHWIDPLTTAFRKEIEGKQRFTISFTDLVFYSNDDKTRSFIGLHLQQGHEKICSLVDGIDKSFKQFKLPIFFEDRSFHISLFWCLGDILPRLSSKLTEKIKTCWETILSDLDQSHEFTIMTLQMKLLMFIVVSVARTIKYTLFSIKQLSL